jgi:hypothetical protein
VSDCPNSPQPQNAAAHYALAAKLYRTVVAHVHAIDVAEAECEGAVLCDRDRDHAAADVKAVHHFDCVINIHAVDEGDGERHSTDVVVKEPVIARNVLAPVLVASHQPLQKRSASNECTSPSDYEWCQVATGGHLPATVMELKTRAQFLQRRCQAAIERPLGMVPMIASPPRRAQCTFSNQVQNRERTALWKVIDRPDHAVDRRIASRALGKRLHVFGFNLVPVLGELVFKVFGYRAEILWGYDKDIEITVPEARPRVNALRDGRRVQKLASQRLKHCHQLGAS